MISLSLDTSNKKTSICLKKNDSYFTETIDSNTPNHCEVLIPACLLYTSDAADE